MMRNPPLPVLPGYDFNRKVGQTRFHKSHHFGMVKDEPMLVDKTLPGIGGAPFPNTVHSRWPSIYCRGDVAVLPSWLAFDKETLVFEAYFQEALQEIEGSPSLPRFVKIHFFLEDGTIQVIEPRVDNSGIHQGVFIQRQRIRFPPDSRSEEFVDIIDLNIGREVDLYGRVFKIVNCDRFTRNFLNRLGISVPDPIVMPEDPYLQERTKRRAETTLAPKKLKTFLHDETQFLKFDRCVLRFYGYWDDRDEPDGILHRIILLYYLADDTIEVKDVIPVNAGRTGGTLMSRSKLPKEFKEIPQPGAHDRFTILNVGPKNRLVFDPLNCGAKNTKFYRETDLAIGAAVNLLGRKVILCDCDEYTKEYYRKNYGLDDFTPHPYPEEKDIVYEAVKAPLPPYNGFGTHQDSAQNCRTIYPVEPVKDLKQFLRKDRDGIDSRVLRFSAQMITNKPYLNTRPFVISYFLADDTMNVFENVHLNSGFQGGMFYGRDKFVKPGENEFGSDPPAYYDKLDCYIGALLELHDHKFLLTGADEYALRYMELNCAEFPKSNIRQIIHKVRLTVAQNYKEFVSTMFGPYLESGETPYSAIRRALREVMGDNITEHEIITIARKFRIDPKPPKDCERIRMLVHCDLKRFLFNNLDRLHESFKHHDATHSGKLSRKQIYTCLRGARLPVDVELTNALIDCIPIQDDGLLYYQDVVNFLDYGRFPAAPTAPVAVRYDLCWMSHAPTVDSSMVDVNAFLEELNLEQDLRTTACGDLEQTRGAGGGGGGGAGGQQGAQHRGTLDDPSANESCALIVREPQAAQATRRVKFQGGDSRY